MSLPERVDRAGVILSTLCVVHCIVTPILLSASTLAAQLLPTESRTHRALLVPIAAVGLLAVVRGLRRHGKRRVLGLMALGLLLIAGAALFGQRLPSRWMEVAVTMLGSVFLIVAHLLNHSFCRKCARGGIELAGAASPSSPCHP